MQRTANQLPQSLTINHRWLGLLYVVVWVIAILISIMQPARAASSATHLVSFQPNEFYDFQVSSDPGLIATFTIQDTRF